MTSNDLSGKRVLVAGVETSLGRAVATGLAAAGAGLAAVATVNDSETAFAVQRLSRKLGDAALAPGQAIDGDNDMAVRVMVRQVAKQMGGLDAIVFGSESYEAFRLLIKHGGRELDRGEGRHFVVLGDHPPLEDEVEERQHSWILVTVRPPPGGDEQEVAEAVARIIAGRQLLD